MVCLGFKAAATGWKVQNESTEVRWYPNNQNIFSSVWWNPVMLDWRTAVQWSFHQWRVFSDLDTAVGSVCKFGSVIKILVFYFSGFTVKIGRDFGGNNCTSNSSSENVSSCLTDAQKTRFPSWPDLIDRSVTFVLLLTLSCCIESTK